MKAFAYLRVSTDEQATSGAGLDGQLHAIREWCRKAGAELAGVFNDDGVSGGAPLDKRVSLLDAVNALGNGDILLVSKRDRLSRDPVSTAVVERMVAKRKARIVSAAGEGTDGDSPTDILLRRVVDAFAEHERLVIAARTRAALQAKKRRGHRTGTVPLGYVADLPSRSLRPDDETPATLIPVVEELAVVERVRAERASGLTLREIAARLTRDRVPTKHGRASWSHSTIQRLLERAS